MKLLEADCSAAGVVSVDGVTVTEAEVLSEGTQDSSGVLLLEEEKAFYITSSAQDVKRLIESLVDIIAKIATIATGLDTASNSPGGQTANIVLLNAMKTQLNATKDNLK